MNPPVGVRRFRCKRAGRADPLFHGDVRVGLSVRYPWTGYGYGVTGLVGHAHRSLQTGAGEPSYTEEPDPPRSEMRRRLLTTTNSKRELFRWKHTHTWNHTQLKTGYIFERPDQAWWVDSENEHPAFGSWACPSPMSDVAVWVRPDADPPTWTEPEAGITLPTLALMTSPGEIKADMSWTMADGITNQYFDIKRKCSRVLCYKDATHADGVLSFTPASPTAILRPNSCGDEGAVVTVDTRWEPFGWSDQLSYSVGYQVDSAMGLNEPPGHLSSVDPWEEGTFTTADLAQLSASKVGDGFRYGSAHADNGFYSWSYIPNGQKFDLIIEASFYRYKRYIYDAGAAGSGMDKMVVHPTDPTGFAGIYGTCYAIF